MMKKKSLITYFIILQFFFCGFLVVALNPTIPSSSTYNYYDLKSSAVDFSNATVISDGYGGSYWNDGSSEYPAIAIDSNDKIHAVWLDKTDGVWGTDVEIMYATYTTATGWSNATVISDGYGGSYWNDGDSYTPAITVNSSNAVHVVWDDTTDGVWGTDVEIMYATYTTATGWSNATVISDGYGGSYWNDGDSYAPAITVNSSNAVHVVWYDDTDGVWGSDYEIMHATYTTATGWSNATVISDGYGGSYWNDGGSYNPAITVNSSNAVHVVWEDATDGIWGSDYEIMHAMYTTATGWSNATVISDGYGGSYWNDDGSFNPAIAIDSSDKVQVVWNDKTDGVWSTDVEIMYATYTTATGWSNATVISDGYGGSYWNDADSYDPAIAVDNSDRVHVVWYDQTDGVWGNDNEIMYATYTIATEWSNATVISDGYGGSYWNDGHSWDPAMAINTNQVHVVWEDETHGAWGTDREIMYTNIEIPGPPLNPSIIINNGDTSTNSTLVDLTLSADGATEMCFRNGTTGSWSSWEAYATAKQLHLEGSINNTEYSIYVKFQNALGETNPIGDSILYLVFSPLNPSIIINNGDMSTNSTLVDLTLSADGATEMCFRNGTTGSWSSWEAFATAKQLHLEGSINNTEYSIYVKFRNATGETNPIGDSILYLIAEEVEEEIPLEIPGYPIGLLIVLLLGEIGVIMIIKKSKRIKLKK